MRTINRFGIVVMAVAIVAAPLRAQSEGPIAKSVSAAAVSVANSANADAKAEAAPVVSGSVEHRSHKSAWVKFGIAAGLIVGGGAIVGSHLSEACWKGGVCNATEQRWNTVGSGVFGVSSGVMIVWGLMDLMHPKHEAASLTNK